MVEARPYRPSNGTEGDIFISEFCDRCRRDAEDAPCLILTRTMFCDIDDPDYPSEWITDASGPHCTAFQAHPVDGGTDA